MSTQESQLKPREEVYDPEFLSWLQERGLIEIVEKKPTIKGFGPKAAGFGIPTPIMGMEDVPVNVRQGMKDDFLHFIKGKGYSVLDEPLPSREEAQARLAQSTQELRDIYMQRSGATIGPIEREKVEAAPAVSPAQKARFLGQPTIGRPRGTEKPVSMGAIAEEKATRVEYWGKAKEAVEKLAKGDGTGWFDLAEAGLDDTRRFWRSFSNITSLIKKGKSREALQLYTEASINGLTGGIVSPAVIDKMDQLFIKAGITKKEYKTAKERRESAVKALGYYPTRSTQAVSLVWQLLPITKVAKEAKALAAPISSIPAVRSLLTALIAGFSTGAAGVLGSSLAGDEKKLDEDIKAVPTHMLYWALFEFGSLGAETVSKIVNWNLRYAGKVSGTGKFGGAGAAQGIEFETHYAPGRGPTTRTNFTAEELRDIFRRGDPSYTGEGRIPTEAEGASWERNVYNAIRDARGWREAVRRGWMSPQEITVPGEPPIITGTSIRRTRTVPPSAGGEEIPIKPDWGQVFRKGGAPRQWPAPEILEGAPAAAGAPIPARPAPGAVPPPEMGPQAQPAPSAAPPAGAPPPGSAPPAISGAPRAQEAPPPPPRGEAPPTREVPPAREAAPTDQPWKKTQLEFYESRKSGPFALDPIEAKNIHKVEVEAALKRGDPVSPEVLKDYPDLQTPVEARKEPAGEIKFWDDEGRGYTEEEANALAKEKGGVGLYRTKPTPEQIAAAQEGRGAERKRASDLRTKSIAREMAKAKPERTVIQIQQELVKLKGTIEDLRDEGDPENIIPNLEAQRERLTAEYEAAKGAGPERPAVAPQETPEAHVRRIFKSRAEAQKKRGRVGIPKDAPDIVRDILKVTSNKGIGPILTSSGKVSEEYDLVPKYLKSKYGMAIDDIESILEREYGYRYGKGRAGRLLDDLGKIKFKEAFGKERAEEPSEADMERMDEEIREGVDRAAEAAGIKTKEESHRDFMDRMTSEAIDSGLGEDETWNYVQAKFQAMKAWQEKYTPVMNEGETFGAFMARMKKEAAGAGMTEAESLIYADRLLRRKTGFSDPRTGEPFAIIGKPGKGEKGSAWYSNLEGPDGKAAIVQEPPAIPGGRRRATADTASNVLGQLDYDEHSAMAIPEWRITLDRWIKGSDPDFNEFMDTIKRIYGETDGYGRGEASVPYMPPPLIQVAIEKNFTGHKGIRMFQLKWALAHDIAARLYAPVLHLPHVGTGILHMRPFPEGHPLAGRGVGAFLRPAEGLIFLNPHYMADGVLDDPWRATAQIKNVVLHELTHYWEPVHNEDFTSKNMVAQMEVAHLDPYLVQLAQQITGNPALVDKRKTFIVLGPGRGAQVSNQIIRLAGNETAKAIAESKELTDADRKLYEPKAIPGAKPGGKGERPPGEPGAAGYPRAGGRAELPYPRGDAEARAAGVGVRPGRDVGWKPSVQAPPEGEFKLEPTPETPPPFKPAELGEKQGVLPMEAETELFKKKPDERFLVLTETNKVRPPRPRPRPLPVQPRIPETGIYTAVRTDDGGIYFGTEPNHYMLIQKLGVPPERIVGGGFIKDGDYIESPWSEAGGIGGSAREAIGLPREAFSITGKSADDIMPEIIRLTTGKFFPKEWMGNTHQEIDDNTQNLARFVLENYKPEMGPLENYIQKNKGFFYRGGRSRNVQGPLREEQFPEALPEVTEKESVFAPESQPKNKPMPEPEIPGETLKKDLFGSEEIRALNTLRRAGQGYAKQIGAAGAAEDKIIEILKSRILQYPPESYSSLADRLGVSRKTAQNYFNGALEIMRNDPVMIELLKSKNRQMNIGPVPSEEDLRRLAKMLRKYFSSYRGADRVIDMENDRRIGARMAEIFNETLDSGKLRKWIDDQPAGVNEYVLDLIRGGITGDGYQDIANSSLPAEIKTVLTNIRRRIDNLSELIILYGGLAGDTKAGFENNLGKYLTKSYRLWEDKRWDPSEAERQGFKRFIMAQYNMTDAQADDFIEAELSYARNDEGLRPRRRRRTRRIPTDNFIRRRDLSPEWRKFAGEIDRVPWLTLNTVTKQATMAYNARFLDWIADYLPDHWVANFEEAARRGWQDSRFPEHSYSYGKLAGKWVDSELFKYIKSEVDTNRSDIEEFIQKVITNPFKWTKTIGSLPANMRNFLSNTMLSMLARNSILNPLNAKWYVQAAKIHLNKTTTERDAWAKLIADGVTETQYYGSADIPRTYNKIMRFDPDEWYDRVYDALVRRPIDLAGQAYNFEDSLYRVSTSLKNRAPRSEGGFGMNAQESLEEINASLQNYRKLPLVVDTLRRWPILGPFVSFKWNIVKIIGNQARMAAEEIKVPRTRAKGIFRGLRLALLLALPAILSEVSKRTNNVDEEKIKELERWYPEYRRNGTFFYFRDKNGDLKIFDFTYIWPTGDFERFGKAVIKGDVKSAMDAIDFLAHPLLDVWGILVTGKDPTWGTKYRSVWDRAAAAAKLLYLPASMPIPNLEGLLKGDLRPGNLTGPQIKSIIDAFNQQPDQYGRVKDLPEEIKNFFTGIRTWSVEPEKLLAQAAVVRNSQIREIQGELSSWLRKNSKAPKWEIENHTKKFREQVDRIAAELGDIKTLREELARTKFRITRY